MTTTTIEFNEKPGKFQREIILDPRSKIIILLVFTIVILYSSNLYLLVSLTYTSLIMSILSKIKIKHLVISSLFLSVFSLIATLLAYYTASVENPYKFFLIFVSRFVGVYSISAWFFLTVEPYELAVVLEKTYVPAKLVWFIIMIYQFIPTVTREAQEINEIKKLKGLDAKKWEVKVQARILKKTLKPLILGAINRGVDLAEAMVMKGFEPRRRQEHVLRTKLRTVDVLAMIISISVLVLVIIYLPK